VVGNVELLEDDGDLPWVRALDRGASQYFVGDCEVMLCQQCIGKQTSRHSAITRDDLHQRASRA
jgi:hypothetical protein